MIEAENSNNAGKEKKATAAPKCGENESQRSKRLERISTTGTRNGPNTAGENRLD